MNIGNNFDGLSRNERMEVVNRYSNVLSQNKSITNTRVDNIYSETFKEIRTLTTDDKYNTIVPPQAIIINDSINNITATTDAQSNDDISQITTDSVIQANIDIQTVKDTVNLEITAILNQVNDEIADLIANGTPPTVAKQDEMFRVAFGYPMAADAATAQQMYYDDNVKSGLGYPTASDVATAETLYSEQLLKTNLGFPDASTIMDAEDSYKDLQLRIAFGYPDAADAASASQAYFDKNMSTFLGYPNTSSLQEAEDLWYDNYMKVLINKPELILVTVPQATQDQMYKDAFGYPSAPTVHAARNSYIAVTMATLRNAVEVQEPLTYPRQRTDMDLVSQAGIRKAPVVERKQDILDPERISYPSTSLHFFRDSGQNERNQKNNVDLQQNNKTNMDIGTKLFTHEERVFGRPAKNTTTQRSSMALNPLSRAKTTREQRIAKSNSYSTLYNHAEEIVKKKVLRDAKMSIFYTQEEVKQMVLEQLNQGRIRSRQPNNVAKPVKHTTTQRSSMAINPIARVGITREQRISKSNSYNALYRHAEEIVKRKVLRDAKMGIFYTQEEVKQMVYDELAKQ